MYRSQEYCILPPDILHLRLAVTAQYYLVAVVLYDTVCILKLDRALAVPPAWLSTVVAKAAGSRQQAGGWRLEAAGSRQQAGDLVVAVFDYYILVVVYWDQSGCLEPTPEGCIARKRLSRNQSAPESGIVGSYTHYSGSAIRCILHAGFPNTAIHHHVKHLCTMTVQTWATCQAATTAATSNARDTGMRKAPLPFTSSSMPAVGSMYADVGTARPMASSAMRPLDCSYTAATSVVASSVSARSAKLMVRPPFEAELSSTSWMACGATPSAVATSDWNALRTLACRVALAWKSKHTMVAYRE